jgi:hypothetical protein
VSQQFTLPVAAAGQLLAQSLSEEQLEGQAVPPPLLELEPPLPDELPL